MRMMRNQLRMLCKPLQCCNTETPPTYVIKCQSQQMPSIRKLCEVFHFDKIVYVYRNTLDIVKVPILFNISL